MNARHHVAGKGLLMTCKEHVRTAAPFASLVTMITALTMVGVQGAWANHVSVGPSVVGTVLLYQGGAGADDVAITGSLGTYTVTDPHGFTARSGCTPISHTEATCAGAIDVIWVRTGDGNDTVHVSTDVPAEIHGGAGTDTLVGGAENDTFVGGSGADFMSGGTGSNAADYSQEVQGPVTVSLDGVANDGITGEGDNVQPDIATVKGTPFADALYGSNGPDNLQGFKGDDQLNGGGGADVLVGGPGNDVLQGKLGNDTLIGGAGNDYLGGNPGNDVLTGGAGNDILSDFNGVDTFSGGTGDDTIDSSEFLWGLPRDNDPVNCGAGSDTVSADTTDTLTGCETVTLY